MADRQTFEGIVEFSKASRYLCHADVNGVVKIWDVITGVLKQEYAPSSHLSVQCTCISWSPNCESKSKSPKKKRRKIENKIVENECELIALGSSDGSILLYNVNESVVHSKLTGGHDGSVTAVCWNAEGSKLFSCSEDGHIVEWSVTNTSVIKKWKSDQGRLSSIVLCQSQEHLLTANKSIQLWDLKTRKVVQTFVGHTTEVVKLCEVPNLKNTQNHNNSVDCDFRSIEGNYVVSMAKGEHKISVRQISSSERSSDLLASFSVTEEPLTMDINLPASDKQAVQMVVVTKHGKIAYFESVLNGRQKKPLKAKQMTTVVSKDGDKERSLPVVASSFSSNDGSICFVYEDFIVPVFEIIPPNDLQEQLVREDPRRSKISSQKSNKRGFTKTEEKEVASISGKKIKMDEMALGDRLSTEEKMMEAKPDAKTVKTDSSAILLAQGLRSKDKKILNAVLQKTSPTYIKTTVSELPVSHLAALVSELHRRMSGHAQSGKVAARWLRAVLSTHGSYLTAVPNIHDLLEPVTQTIETPIQSFAKLLQLRGRLECFTSQLPKESRPSERMDSSVCEINHNDENYRIDNTMSEDEWEEDETGN